MSILVIIDKTERSVPLNVSLTPQLESLVRQKVESGSYNNASEVVRDALRLLDARDRQLSWLRSRMADAAAQIECGEMIEVTGTFWDDLNREVEARIARGHVPSPDVCP
jgi:antitoxin ParD1/3/4